MNPSQREVEAQRLKEDKVWMKKRIKDKINHCPIEVENMLKILIGGASKRYKYKNQRQNDQNNG